MEGSQDPMDPAFLEDVPAPVKRGIFYEVFTPGPGETISAVVLSHRPTITRTHFQDNKSYACVGIVKGCAWCKVNIAPRIKGYLAGLDSVKGRKVMLELTFNCLQNCQLLHKGGPSLRGRTLYLCRKSQANNGRVMCYFKDTSSVTVLRSLPAPFDVVKACKKMWRLPSHEVNPETGEATPLDHAAYFPADLNPDQQEPAQGDFADYEPEDPETDPASGL